VAARTWWGGLEYARIAYTTRLPIVHADRFIPSSSASRSADRVRTAHQTLQAGEQRWQQLADMAAG
jgi:hypothetical protein